MLSFALLHKSFKHKYWLLQFQSSGGIAPIHFPSLCLPCVSAFFHLCILLLGMQSLVSEPCQQSTRHIHSGYVCVLIIMFHLTEAIIFSNKEDKIWSAIHSELRNCVILVIKNTLFFHYQPCHICILWKSSRKSLVMNTKVWSCCCTYW